MTEAVEMTAPDAEESDFSPRKMKVATAVLFGTLFGSSILPMMSIGLLLTPMTEEFGWSRTGFSGGLTAMMLAGALSAPILGQLVDKVGARLMIIGGTAIVGFATMSLSLQQGALWQFYAGFAALGFTGSTVIGYSKIIGALFNKHRGKALAIFGVESSIAGAVAPPLIQYLISSFGWRGMFIGLGLIILSVIPLLLIWLQEPDKPNPAKDAGPADQSEMPGLTVSEAMRTRDFWFILLAAFLALGPAFGLMPHIVPYLLSRGFSIEVAVGMLSTMQIAMAVGTVVGGLAIDHFDTAKIAAPFSAVTTMALLILIFVSAGTAGFALLFIAMSSLGFAGGAKRPMATFFQLRFFGLKAFASLMGVQTPFLAFCMGVSPLLVGWTFDKYKTYEPAFIVMTAVMAVTIVLYLALGPYRFAKDLAPVAQK